jgi:hypothetical protein
MTGEKNAVLIGRQAVVKAQGEEPVFKAGDGVRISVRFPIGHFRVPTYIRGKRGWIESVIEPPCDQQRRGRLRTQCRKQVALLPCCHSIERTLAAVRRFRQRQPAN